MPHRKLPHQTGIREKIIKLIKRIPFWLSLLSVLVVVYDLGFDQQQWLQKTLNVIFLITLLTGIISITGRYFSPVDRPRKKVWLFDALIAFLLFCVLVENCGWLHIPLIGSPQWLHVLIFVVFIREFSALKTDLKKKYFNPAQLFILSFLVIIVTGTFLLLLPNATHSGISGVDALFTSTSAVCVTGLIVVDTGTYFTHFGQIVILILIQLGGLGIMTFTSYFSYFFRGGSTYENQLLIKGMTNAEKVAEVFSTLKKIILLTFIIEIIGALLIYINLNESTFSGVNDQIFFSVFHSISGFCNAGFSTLTDGLYDGAFRFNYPLHMILATLFIIGGIGFPIMFNFYKYLKHILLNRLLPVGFRKPAIHAPWVININTRIVLITTGILILSGTILFYIFEYNNALSDHDNLGKITTAFFSAVTPRTAGFNTVDFGTLNISTLMLILLLMWIGASPGSTGGGIKTSTFAVGTLNFLSLARGKNRIEVFRREVADISVRRAFAIISLSLVVIGVAVFFVTFFDSDKNLITIAFECFSAYSTVGLSMGITGDLTNASKIVLVITMFIGRVSMLAILIAVFKQVKHMKYRYPNEEILIN